LRHQRRIEATEAGLSQDLEKMDAATKRGLARASVDGRALLNEVIRSGDLGKRVNGWNVPPPAMGRAGLSDDFLLRASLQCLGGIIANDPAEAIYFNTTVDSTGQAFDGTKRYTLRFPPGRLPQVNAFWSITMYDPTYNLVANPIDRYAIGNRTPGLTADQGHPVWLPDTGAARLRLAGESFDESTSDVPRLLIPALPNVQHILLDTLGRQHVMLRSGCTSLQLTITGQNSVVAPVNLVLRLRRPHEIGAISQSAPWRTHR
jgi:hypothetical protein